MSLTRNTTGRDREETILLMRPDHIGDLLLTTPALYALRLARPKARISILIGPWSAGLLKGNPDPDEVIVCGLPWLARTQNACWRSVLSTLTQLRARQFDHIVNFRVAARAAAFSRLCCGNRRWGFDVRKSRWAWTDVVPYSRDRHVVDNYMDLVGAVGASRMTPRFRLFPDVEDLMPIQAYVEPATPAVVLAVTAGYPAKLWQPERWAEVADRIAEQGFRILFSAGPGERDYVEWIRGHMRAASISLAGKLSLLQFAAVLRRAFCLIALDSFPMHLGVAVGTPVVALFGATSSSHWGPYPTGQPSVVLEPPSDIPRRAAAMKWITSEHVLRGFERLLDQLGAK